MKRACEHCGAQFYVRPSAPKGHGRFCSKPCKGAGMMRGKSPANARHLMSYTPTWKAWDSMKQRCLNAKHKSYAEYGGRGITVDPAWLTFDGFFADMGERPDGLSLGRIDNDGGYSKTNCRWETLLQQGGNRRDNKRVTAFGETHHIAEWARRRGVPRSTLGMRLRAGWSAERALTHPVDHRKGKRK
jgi:hypothetical protein